MPQYQALYRKYRPQRFDEVIGQDHVTKTLAREVVDGKVAHAYLFAGPRGTGKTTTARLLAKSLNCADTGPDGEPDNKCTSCLEIAATTSLDVIELDAASHNKVDDIREIRVNVGTVAAAGGARRVYILDEAHMLSRAAGNALLKTLEEPPEHVIFVLATTEPYKLLDTVRSRAQRFDFHPVGPESLISYMADIADREGFEASYEGLAAAATHASGSVRDALSLLEQVAALGGGNVTPEGVTRALGLADRDAFDTLAGAISNGDAPAALGLIAHLTAQGADLRRFVTDSLGFFRGIFLAQYAPNLEDVSDEPLEVIEQWRRHAADLATADVLRTVDGLGDALAQLREGREERLVIELTLLKLTRPETSADPAALSARLDRMERRLREVESNASASPDIEPAAAESDVLAGGGGQEVSDVPGQVVTEAEVEPVDRDVAQLLEELDLEQFESAWPALVARVKEEVGPRRHAYLKEAIPVAVEEGRVVFEIPAHLDFHLEQLKADGELQQRMVAIAEDLLGGRIALEFRASDGEESPGDEQEPVRAPDKDQLEEADESATDPTELVVDALGGEVVSE